MNSVLIHPQLEKSLNRFVATDAHALLLSGPLGSGKGFLMRKMIEDILGVPAQKAFSSQSGLLICPVKGTIGIDAIREMRRFLQLRTTGQGRIRRAVVIEDAETMTIEAQNALLKILEEPPLDTVLLLSVNGEEALRPTIYSRVQHLRMRNPAKTDTVEYFKKLGHGEQKITSVYHLADGQVGLMRRLLDDEDDTLASQLTLAKKIITSKTYDRLLLVDALAKEKETLPTLLFALKQVCRAALVKSTEKQEKVQIKRLYERIQAIYDTEVALVRNPNNKLLISSLMLNL